MPEDYNPGFAAGEQEARLVYFTLLMALNYQRDSYKLWQSALLSYQDPDTKDIFSIGSVREMGDNLLRKRLIKHRLALQPNRHISRR